jgi:hypothetical protein
MSSRPKIAARKAALNKVGTPAATSLRSAGALLLAILLAATSVRAQGAGATGRSAAVVRSGVSTTVGSVVSVRAIGAPVYLADGRIEQRYRVVANAPFALRDAGGRDGTVTLATGPTSETRLRDFTGSAGIYDDVRVRTVAADPPELHAEPSPSSALATARRSGR